MIAKCIAVLAIVAQINAFGCNGVVSNGCSGGAITRNIVAKGKFPVALQNCGPVPDRTVPVTTSHVQAPVQQKPTVRLGANIPAPRTVAHSCTCYKTILRPRVHQQLITVPSIQRYIETTHTPIVENIHYEACPVNSVESVNGGAAVSGSVIGVAAAPAVASNYPVAVGFSGVSAVPAFSSVPVSSAVPVASYSAGCPVSACY